MKKYFIKKESPIPFTQAGYEKVLKDKEKLVNERPAAVEHLRLARGMGDLSENGYYKASRQRLSYIDARLRSIERLIKLAQIVSSTHVVLSDGTKTYEYTIVGGFESDPANKTISHLSPMGRATIGKKPGDTIIVHTPKGDTTYTLVSIK